MDEALGLCVLLLLVEEGCARSGHTHQVAHRSPTHSILLLSLWVLLANVWEDALGLGQHADSNVR